MKSKLLALMLCVSMTVLGEEKGALPLPTSGNVTLSLAEYNRLVDLAARSSKKHEAPPIPYTIKRAELKFKVTNGEVLGTMLMDGEVFSKGAAKVPLTTGITILNAHQEGRNLPLQQEGLTSVAVLQGAQDFAVMLETGLPLSIDAGRASFTLPVPAAGSVRLSLAIPGDRTDVRINPGLITGRTSSNGQTMVEATLVPGQTASIWWATHETAVPVVPHEVRFLSDVKTLVSVSEAELRIAALADVTVVQGEPTRFTVEAPAGYEITGASGATVDSSEIHDGALILHLNSGTPRSHQFLITMERPLAGAKAETPFLSFKDSQRETGEVLVEGAGAMELTATEGGGLKRIDVKEMSPYLRSLSRFPMQAAFRYHRQPTETPKLALEWVRFPDSTVLAAVAEKAVVTTLVTTEGRSLTEVQLTVKNQAQPFLKVGLPAGTTILSAEVAGEKVKPVQGADGSRVPLLRPGFRPTGPYEVSFVFMHAGAPFAKKGGSDLELPSMDVPINMLQWEVFLPEQYKVKDFGGDAISASLLAPPTPRKRMTAYDVGTGSGIDLAQVEAKEKSLENTNGAAGFSQELLPGQVAGVVTDSQGAVVSGAQVKVVNRQRGLTRTATTDSTGYWRVSSMPSGNLTIEISAKAFKTTAAHGFYDSGRPATYRLSLVVGAASETVEVTAAAPLIETTNSQVTHAFSGTNLTTYANVNEGDNDRQTRGRKKDQHIDGQNNNDNSVAQNQASANVVNLQKRVAGVLPVRIDVPRAGNSYRFVRPLVLDEETKVTFNYRSK